MPILIAALRQGGIAARAGGHVELAAHDGVDFMGLALFVKIESAEHVPMVGDGEARHIEGFCGGNERLHGRRTVQKRKIRMIVEMNKLWHGF